jgi:cellobiose-specific phosphotransferase system component IIC
MPEWMNWVIAVLVIAGEIAFIWLMGVHEEGKLKRTLQRIAQKEAELRALRRGG